MIAINKIIEKPISGEWGDECDAVNVIRTTNFSDIYFTQNLHPIHSFHIFAPHNCQQVL